MIIHDFYFVRLPLTPFETNSPLIVDAYAVLSSPFSLQRFQSVARRYPQSRQIGRGVNHPQFSHGNPVDFSGKSPGGLLTK